MSSTDLLTYPAKAVSKLFLLTIGKPFIVPLKHEIAPVDRIVGAVTVPKKSAELNCAYPLNAGVIVAFVMIGELLIDPVVAEMLGVITLPVKVAPDN